MYFRELVTHLEQLEKTPSRNEMTRILAGVIRGVTSAEADIACYLLLGKLLPSYRGVEFNIAEKTVIRVLALAYDRNETEIMGLYKSRGDLGDAAGMLAANRGTPRGQALTIRHVYEALRAIAEDSGAGSQDRKIHAMARLLTKLDARAAKFITRIPLGKLRLGFSDATLLDALSYAEKGDKSARPLIERAYNVTADIGAIVQRVKQSGLSSLTDLEPKPGIPIRPSLAERIRTIAEAVEKAGSRVGVERKLDGFRTQIHVWTTRGKKEVALFSRNLESTTTMFPEIVAAAARLPVRSIILDGETIGYNPHTGKFAPFQETVKRKRKHHIAEFAKKIPLSIFVFDVLYHNGRSLLALSFEKRRAALEKILGSPTPQATIRLAEQKITEDPAVIARGLETSLKAGLEGLVIKNLQTPYQAGSRGFHWIKLKATSAALEELRGGAHRATAQLLDTIDCLVMGAYKGRGKRTKFGVGGFLLGVRVGDRYFSISRLGTGLSDEQFREAYRRLQKVRVGVAPPEYAVDKESAPDFWAKPSVVVEILADEITLSPRHTAGRKKEGGRGYSLRFPRLVRFRNDKNPEDVTTVSEIKKLYQQQKSSS